ncbi:MULTISPECIES: tetratricopeptide repeat protein [unclassified Streptococcus]|uniref:tetratricopeptide repeat protein n=1 Tax=unclassified Streptococcus TaxID=2608887 RepID=UPI00359F0D83
MTNSEKMIACLDQQDLRKADKYFQRALADDSDDVLLELGEYLEAIGFYPQARQVYEQLSEQYPHVNLSLAQIAYEDGDKVLAFDYLTRIEEDSDDYISALLVLADLYDSEGLTDVARDKLVLASQLTDEPLVIFGLAELEFALEDYSSAISHYAKLDNRLLLEQTGISTYERIGRSYASLGQFEAAIEFLEKALEIEYDGQTNLELATLYYETNHTQRACLLFKQLETLSPEIEGYEYPYALSLEAEDQFSEALRLVQQALRKNAFDTQLLLLASQLSYELADAVQSETYLKEVLALDEDNEEAKLRLSNLYLEQERHEEVIGLGLEISDHPLTLWQLAQAYVALDREDEALVLYDQTFADLSDNPDFLLAYAYLLRRLGDLEKAKTILQTYLRLIPDDLAVEELLSDLSYGD